MNNLNEALNLSENIQCDLDRYTENVRKATIELLLKIGVSKNTLDKWDKSDIPNFDSVDDFCRKVRKPHKFVDILTRKECDELIFAYAVLNAKSNSRVKKSYQQMQYEYDYLYKYKNHPIESLGMETRTVNAIRRNLNAYINSKEDFLSLKENTIKYTKGIGAKSLNDILEAQRKLRENEIEWGGN